MPIRHQERKRSLALWVCCIGALSAPPMLVLTVEFAAFVPQLHLRAGPWGLTLWGTTAPAPPSLIVTWDRDDNYVGYNIRWQEFVYNIYWRSPAPPAAP